MKDKLGCGKKALCAVSFKKVIRGLFGIAMPVMIPAILALILWSCWRARSTNPGTRRYSYDVGGANSTDSSRREAIHWQSSSGAFGFENLWSLQVGFKSVELIINKLCRVS